MGSKDRSKTTHVWSATAHISCASGGLDLVSLGIGEKKETQTFVNELKVRARGTIDPVQKIRVMMKEELSFASPRVRAVEPTRT